MSDSNKRPSGSLGAHYDVIVIGGGHAGVEAACAAARTGAQTLLLTHSLDALGQMSCNPAIGGIGKGHLVKEVDALGGIMAQAIDQAGIHYRTLNASKGPAVQATRAQADRNLYRQAIRRLLDQQSNLYLFQQGVADLILSSSRVTGVITDTGMRFYAQAVVLTAGTFLGGRMHVGLCQQAAGRAGDPPANALAQRLRALPFRVCRLKTGTPPRIDRKTIDFSNLEEQPSEWPVPRFPFVPLTENRIEQVACHITYTQERTHEIIRRAFDQSPLHCGKIEGVGPRYCPSVEDKVIRFKDKTSHQVFLEPEGLGVDEVYPNGISTSLPFDVQCEFVRTMPGLENAHLTRPGYAIEYDCFDPRDLHPWLETQPIQRLFFAGQINGTTGYEEAAAQGIIAGLNAARLSQNLSTWTPRRDQAYIGVMIDDLVTCGTLEPYRMFTSRAEYRLLLREDNADLRLTEVAYELGLVNAERKAILDQKRSHMDTLEKALRNTTIHPAGPVADHLSEHMNLTLSQACKAWELLKRPDVKGHELIQALGWLSTTDPQALQQLDIQRKYGGYIERQHQDVARQLKHENQRIPSNIVYQNISGLSTEVIEKLSEIQPATLGQASRIPGVTPAAISILMIWLKRKEQTKNKGEKTKNKVD